MMLKCVNFLHKKSLPIKEGLKLIYVLIHHSIPWLREIITTRIIEMILMTCFFIVDSNIRKEF
jgi:hypothetical protein